MSLITPHIGIQMGDVASAMVGETFYRAYSWLNVRTNSVVVSIYTEQEHGQEVLVRTDMLMQAERLDGDLDSPKLIAVGSTLVLHWVAGLELDRRLHRATFDLTAIQGSWTLHASVATHPTGLYDVAATGHATDFLLVDRTVDGEGWAAYRVTPPYGWIDFAWIETYKPGMADRVLACYAHDGDGDVLVSYQAHHVDDQGVVTAQNQLWTARHNWGNGAQTHDVQSFVDFDDMDAAVVGHCRLAQAHRVAIVAEMRGTNDAESGLAGAVYNRGVAYRQLNSFTAARVGGEHGTVNLHLVSRPWAHRTGRFTEPLTSNVYCVVSYKSQRTTSPWEQSYGYVVNLDFWNWWRPSGLEVRARPICSITDGSFDGRPTAFSPITAAGINPNQGKRMNHLSHAALPPPHGPNTRTRTVACTFFARNIAISAGGATTLQPVGASIVGLRCFMEEPWIAPRDVTSAPLPVDRNVNVAYPLGCYEHTQVGDGLVIGGGTPSVYDGRDVVELGFVHGPEILEVSIVPAPLTGNLQQGFYTYVAVYEWEDAQGQVHRSRPSRPVRAESASDERRAFIHVRTIGLSLKENRVHCPDASNISIVVYRTATNGVTLRRTYAHLQTWGGSAPGLDQTPQNNPHDFRVILIDNTADATLNFNEQFPWTLVGGGFAFTDGPSGLPQIPLEAGGPMARWQNRLWMASSIRPNKLLYSKEIVEAEGSSRYGIPEFTPFHVFSVDGISEITAMHAMDSQLIVWTRDGTYRLVGEGADDAGMGSSLMLEVVAEGTGCIEPRSVVLGPPGLFFQSAKGYYLLNRGLELDYVTSGAAVEDFVRAAGNVRAATLLEDRHQIRVVCDGAPELVDEAVVVHPTCLIYDYFHRQWSGIRLPRLAQGRQAGTAGACSWRGTEGQVQHVVLEQGAVLLERGTEDPDRYADDELDPPASVVQVAVPAEVETGWIHVAGISGYKRVRSIGIQLRKPNPSPVSVTLTYDFDGSYDESISETFEQPADTSKAYIRVRPSHQKISAIKIAIYEPVEVPATENLAITSIVLECGLKKGPRRVSSQQIGA